MGDISTMNALLISLLVFALIFGGALVGAVVRPLLSEQHLHPDSKDIAKMATGLIGTLAALVLGACPNSGCSTLSESGSSLGP
jgi:fluoride ion exporter CrcB/FEX